MAAQMPPGENIGGADLPDHTTSANAVPQRGSQELKAGDLTKGYHDIGQPDVPLFSDQTTGENEVGDPLAYGGFLKRPQGWQR